MRNLIRRLDVEIARASFLRNIRNAMSRRRQKPLPKINEGDSGPRIVDKDGRVKRLNNAYTRIRVVSPAAAEEIIIVKNSSRQ